MSQYGKGTEPPVELQPYPVGSPPPYSPPGVDPAQYPAPAIAVTPTAAGGTYVQNVTVQFQFPDTPVPIVCKFCGKSIVTVVDSKCLWGRLFTCVFCFACLILVGFCTMSTKNCECQAVVHTCPECKRVLGMAK